MHYRRVLVLPDMEYALFYSIVRERTGPVPHMEQNLAVHMVSDRTSRPQVGQVGYV